MPDPPKPRYVGEPPRGDDRITVDQCRLIVYEEVERVLDAKIARLEESLTDRLDTKMETAIAKIQGQTQKRDLLALVGAVAALLTSNWLLIDSKLELAVKNEVQAQMKAERAAELKSTLNQSLPDSHSARQPILRRLSDEIQRSKLLNQPAPLDDIKKFSRELASKSDLSESDRKALSELAAYGSSAIKIPPGTWIDMSESQIPESLRITSGFGYKKWLFRVAYPGESFAGFGMGNSEFREIPKAGHVVYEGGSFLLENVHLRNWTFKDVVIGVMGRTVILENVKFVNCTFNLSTLRVDFLPSLPQLLSSLPDVAKFESKASK